MTLPLPQPTMPGLVLGIIARDGDKATVQCTRCYETHTDTLLFAVQWAPFHSPTERLCPDCRKACGCHSCEESLR